MSRDPGASDTQRRVRGLLILAAIYIVVAHLIPRPEAIQPQGWRLLGIFLATVAGLILRPISGGAVVLIGVTASALAGGLTMQEALGGYAEPAVWLVLAAFFISRALLNTGLARRIALFFVRLFGKSSVGVCYALTFSDMVLASIIPSNAARSGGVILPIARSISELYKSHPGPSATLLGSFLITGIYQGVCVTAAMFFTGQASNPLAAGLAGDLGYPITWAWWLAAGIVPGLCSLLVIPWVVLRINPPEIRRTPEARDFAVTELREMGAMRGPEKIACTIFVAVCGMWVTSGWHGLHITLPALLGAGALLVTGVLRWEDIRSEKAAWDIFIWYGGLLRLGKALNDSGVTMEFAEFVGAALSDAGWVTLFAIALLIYFYAHYGFASITAHLLAMYTPFMAVLLAKDAPIGLIAFSFACFANFAAGLTNYGTTPSPMFFAHDYVSLGKWFRIGFFVSLVNIAIWSTVGFGWWKLIGVW